MRSIMLAISGAFCVIVGCKAVPPAAATRPTPAVIKPSMFFELPLGPSDDQSDPRFAHYVSRLRATASWRDMERQWTRIGDRVTSARLVVIAGFLPMLIDRTPATRPAEGAEQDASILVVYETNDSIGFITNIRPDELRKQGRSWTSFETLPTDEYARQEVASTTGIRWEGRLEDVIPANEANAVRTRIVGNDYVWDSVSVFLLVELERRSSSKLMWFAAETLVTESGTISCQPFLEELRQQAVALMGPEPSENASRLRSPVYAASRDQRQP